MDTVSSGSFQAECSLSSGTSKPPSDGCYIQDRINLFRLNMNCRIHASWVIKWFNLDFYGVILFYSIFPNDKSKILTWWIEWLAAINGVHEHQWRQRVSIIWQLWRNDRWQVYMIKLHAYLDYLKNHFHESYFVDSCLTIYKIFFLTWNELYEPWIFFFWDIAVHISTCVDIHLTVFEFVGLWLSVLGGSRVVK